MLVSDYHVPMLDSGDGAITFEEKGKSKIIVIPKNNTVAYGIFIHYYYQLPVFKNRQYAIAKWIVRDIRKEGFVCKKNQQNDSFYKPVPIHPEKDSPWKRKLSLVEELYWLHHELELIKKKLYWNSKEKSTL